MNTLHSLIPTVRLVRRLNELRKIWLRPTWTHTHWDLWKNVQREFRKYPDLPPLNRMSTTHKIKEATDKLEEWIQQEHRQVLQARLPQWTQAMRESWKGDRKLVWGWVRSRLHPRSACDSMLLPSGLWTTDPRAILTLLREFWTTLNPTKSLPTKNQFQSKYQHHLTGGKWPDDPITAEEWIRACRIVPPHSTRSGWMEGLGNPDSPGRSPTGGSQSYYTHAKQQLHQKRGQLFWGP